MKQPPRLPFNDRHRATDAIRQVAALTPLAVVTQNLYRQLRQQLGGDDAALTWLMSLAMKLGHPIGLNLSNGRGSSQTLMLAPIGWSEERVQGWTAGFP